VTARADLSATADPDLPPRPGLLVNEWIEKTGGAERVLDSMVSVFPQAPLACLWNDAPDRFARMSVRESPLAHTPLRGRKALSLPFMPAVWHGKWLAHSNAEWALIATHTFAHHAASNPALIDKPTFAYVHTPARYLWAGDIDPRGAGVAARVASPALRQIDRKRAQKVYDLAANSQFVSKRVANAWERDARVIYPPVAVEELTAVADWRSELANNEAAIFETLPEQFVLGASRLVAYKRLDSVIHAGESTGIPVVIAGSGPDEERIRAMAKVASVPVHVLGQVSDAMLRALMQSALVYAFLPIEDFGIMPIEAMALGTPVVVNPIGGARETVELVGHGVVADSLGKYDLKEAIYSAAKLGKVVCKEQLAQFSVKRFEAELSDWVRMV